MKGTNVLVATSISHFINDGNLFVLPVVYAFLVAHDGFSTFEEGIMIGVFAAVPVIVSPFVNVFSKRGGGAIRMIGFGLLVWGVALICISLGVNTAMLWVIIACLVVAGFASTFYHPLGGVALTSTFGKNQATAMGINGSMGSIGRAVYPTLIIVLAGVYGGLNYGMSLALITLGAVSICMSFAPILIKTESKEKPSEEVQEEQKRPYVRIIALLVITYFIWGMFSRGISQFLPTLLVDSFHYNFGIQLGLVYTAALVPPIIGQPLWGLASDRIGRRSMLELSIVGALSSFLLFMFTGSILWLMVYGFCSFSGFPLVLSLVGDLVPKKSNAVSNALVWNVGLSGGGILGPVVIGTLSASIGLFDSVLYITLASATAAFLIPLIPKTVRTKKVQLFG